MNTQGRKYFLNRRSGRKDDLLLKEGEGGRSHHSDRIEFHLENHNMMMIVMN